MMPQIKVLKEYTWNGLGFPTPVLDVTCVKDFSGKWHYHIDENYVAYHVFDWLSEQDRLYSNEEIRFMSRYILTDKWRNNEA